jgi:acetyl-CoA C-acetyltransferase
VDARSPGLPDVYIAMGQTAENVAEFEKVTREEMDEFAVLSQTRAVESRRTASSSARSSRSPWPTAPSSPRTTAPGRHHARGLANLKPVFREGGTVTAGNACPLNDGAAAVIVMSDTKAKALGITPLARIVASGVTGLNPEIMGLGPGGRLPPGPGRANMTIDDIDLVEINEAFAAQVIPSAKHLGISWDKLNVKGGAIALGHPFGQTGARIMTTLLNALEDTGKTFGLESMCVGRRPGHGHDRRAPQLRAEVIVSGWEAHRTEVDPERGEVDAAAHNLRHPSGSLQGGRYIGLHFNHLVTDGVNLLAREPDEAQAEEIVLIGVRAVQITHP